MTLPVLVLFYLRLAGCVTPVSGTPPIALLLVGNFWVSLCNMGLYRCCSLFLL